jgi:hypothetical protein
MASEQNPAAETKASDADGAAVARDRVTALAPRARAKADDDHAAVYPVTSIGLISHRL